MYNSNLTGLQVDGIYGEIHVHDNAISQAIPAGATYTKLNVWSDNGLNKETIPNYTLGSIITLHPGNYKIEASLSFKSGTSNVIPSCSVFVNGVEQDQAHFIRKISVAGDVGSASITGISNALIGQEIDIRMKHDDGSPVDITVVYGNLNVVFLGV